MGMGAVRMAGDDRAGGADGLGDFEMTAKPRSICRHDIFEDCPACMQETIDVLVKALEDIKRATVEGRVCDDVAWFDSITTLHDFCEITLDYVLGRVGGTLS